MGALELFEFATPHKYTSKCRPNFRMATKIPLQSVASGSQSTNSGRNSAMTRPTMSFRWRQFRGLGTLLPGTLRTPGTPERQKERGWGLLHNQSSVTTFVKERSEASMVKMNKFQIVAINLKTSSLRFVDLVHIALFAHDWGQFFLKYAQCYGRVICVHSGGSAVFLLCGLRSEALVVNIITI